MNIDFRSFTITINTNSSITIATNFNAPSGPSSNNYRIVFDNNQSKYLTTSKGSQTQTISSGAVYNYIYQQIGNETSKQFTAYIIYNTSRSNDLQATATIPEYYLSISASSTDTNDGGQTTNYETYQRHYVNEFISENTYLQGWSKPRIDYLISSSTGYLYRGPLTLGGAITGTAQLGTTSLQLGTDFEAGTYSVGAGDGRDAVVASHTISRINWQQPSISINISRYNSVGRRIDWNLEGIWSYISNALQPNVNFQLTYNNNTYTLYTKNDEYYWYDGTHLYKDETGTEIGSFDISTYSLGVPIEYPTLSQVSNVTANGQFILIDENDYKYSISATAYLTDNIDYRVYANDLEPSGLPAIYVHKDSNSNNAVDIYGDLSVDGNLAINETTVLRANDYGDVTLSSASGSNGWLYFRPNGTTDSTGQMTLDGNGNLSVDNSGTFNGTLKVEQNGISNVFENSYGFAHYSTNGSAGHWFNTDVKVQGNVYAGSGYDRQLAFKDEIEKYSTSETAIGTWIDGKTLYRKVVYIPTFGTTGTTVQTGITNTAYVMMYGSLTRIETGHIYSIDNYLMEECRFNPTNGDLQLWSNISGVSFTGYIIFEYTKN